MKKVSKDPAQRITIGNRTNDAELIDRILAYKDENKNASAADAVRELCEIALDFKKLTR